MSPPKPAEEDKLDIKYLIDNTYTNARKTNCRCGQCGHVYTQPGDLRKHVRTVVSSRTRITILVQFLTSYFISMLSTSDWSFTNVKSSGNHSGRTEIYRSISEQCRFNTIAVGGFRSKSWPYASLPAIARRNKRKGCGSKFKYKSEFPRYIANCKKQVLRKRRINE